MDQTTMLITAAAILASLVGLVLWKWGGSGKITLPGGFGAEVKSDQPGPVVRDLDFEGNKNKVDAKGPGARIERIDSKGDENTYTAG